MVTTGPGPHHRLRWLSGAPDGYDAGLLIHQMVDGSETRCSTSARSPHPNDTELISWSPAKVRQSISRIIGAIFMGRRCHSDQEPYLYCRMPTSDGDTNDD